MHAALKAFVVAASVVNNVVVVVQVVVAVIVAAAVVVVVQLVFAVNLPRQLLDARIELEIQFACDARYAG